MPTATMKAPFYGHVRQYHGIKKELDDAILKVLESNQYVMGPALKQFEQDLARYFGMKHAVGLNSGTDALWLVFMALGIQPGDEIITTANTFFATAEAIWIARAKAVFVDCEPRTDNIDPARIEIPRVCTACRLDTFYSYRKGHRGRLATVAALP